MAGPSIIPQKLEGLPREAQRVIKKLNTAQLAHLKAAFTNVSWFNLLDLPLEIRLMIYHFAFENGANVVKVKHKVDATQYHKRLGLIPIPGLALLQTSKQVNQEATAALRSLKICQIDFTRSNGVVSAYQKKSLQLFSRFVMIVPTYDSKFVWSPSDVLGKQLAVICDALEADDSPIAKDARTTVHFEFRSHHTTPVYYLCPDAVENSIKGGFERYRYESLGFKTQIQFMVDQFRRELRKQWPNTTVSSNADDADKDVSCRRLTSEVVLFEDIKRQLKGCAVIRKNRAWQPAQVVIYEGEQGYRQWAASKA